METQYEHNTNNMGNMDSQTIFTKTAKGLGEAVGKTKALPRDLRKILKEVDGTSPVEAVASKLNLEMTEILPLLTKLADDDYIREFTSADAMDKADFDLDLDFRSEARAKKEAEEKEKDKEKDKEKEREKERQRTAIAKIRQEALEKYKHDLEERTKKEKEEQEQARIQQEQEREQVREQVREQARLEAEEQARYKAEQQAKKAAEQKAKQEAKERARLEAKARAKKEAEERAQRKAEEKKQRYAQKQAEKEMREMKEKIRQEEKEKEREREREREKMENAKKAKRKSVPEIEIETETEQPVEQPVVSIKNQKPYKKPVKWGKPAGIVLSVLLLAGVVLAFTMPFNSKLSQFEKLMAAQFQQPVKIGSVHLALLPLPHWRIENVSIGNGGQINIPQVDALARLDTIFSNKTIYQSITLTSPVVNEEGLGWFIFGTPGKDGIAVEEISASNARLVSQHIDLPVFDMKAKIGNDGRWEKMVFDSTDKTMHADLQPQNDTVLMELRAETFAPPFAASSKGPFVLEKFHASGAADRQTLKLSTFSGTILGGYVQGNAALTWGEKGKNWNLNGTLTAQQIDAPKISPQFFDGGKLEGRADYAFEAQTGGRLFSAPRVQGNVTVRNGALPGVNFANVLRGFNNGGKSGFSELNSGFLYERGKLQLRNVRLRAGVVSASGTADADADGQIKGRFTVDLKTSAQQARGHVTLSGTVQSPRFRP